MTVWYNEDLNMIGLYFRGIMQCILPDTYISTLYIGPIESCEWVYVGEFE